MENKIYYAAVQNGCILGVFDDQLKAESRVNEEIKRDFISIVLKRKLRKLFQKTGDVALHRYCVMTITEVKEIK